MDDYKPISCGRHSEFELAIMHGKTLELSWQDLDAGLQSQKVKPVDLIVRNHREYLQVEDDKGKLIEIRLDRIMN